MVSDGTEFAVGDIERLFEEARRNTKAKDEKWEKYLNRRRSDVQIKKPNRRNSNAQHKRLHPLTTKWKKSGVPTNHGDEDTRRRTSSSQEKQRNYNPHTEDQTRIPDKKIINNKRTRKGGANTSRTISLEVLVGNASSKS
ncbi:hypothetical protein TNCV_4720781 [Trichonephila clavipes]|uniref:Uncharacterized protein n=1 Tax=Trichonephila clavipes TaxID=2585209 RepID=A0A8X7BEY4_TRICX|nr:hypothetical protein TNCV_4720781 [Trichonephila clavipes]